VAKLSRRQSFSGNKFRGVWAELKPEAWFTLLKEISPDSEFSLRGEALLGCCPYPQHNDSTPSFWVYPKRGYAKCFGCNRFESNPVRFLSDISGMSWAEAVSFYRNKFSVTSFPKTVGKELDQREGLQRVRSVIAKVSKECLLRALQPYADGDQKSEYAIFFAALKYLEGRGIPLDRSLLKALPVGVLPPLKMVTKIAGPDVSKHCYDYLQKYMTTSYLGALMFSYNDTPTSIGGFKLRADFLRAEGTKDHVYVKNPDDSPIGIFGLKFYSSLIRGNSGHKEALVMEGEFDVLSNLVHQLQDKKPYDIVLGTGGSSDIYLDDLEEFGIEKVLLVPDGPDHGGNEIAESWLKRTNIPANVFTWPAAVKSKDPDEAILTYGWEQWLTALTEVDENSEQRVNFILPHEWAARRLREKLIDADFEDVRALKTLAARVGECLLDPSEQKAYIDSAVQFTGLSPSDLIALIVGGEDTEEGFMQRIVFALQQEYTFLGTEPSQAGLRLTFWHKKKRLLRTASISRTSDLFSTINADLGTFVDWARENVGVPDWVATKSAGSSGGVMPVRYSDQEKIVRNYVELALTRLLKTLPAMQDLIQLKAGCHYIDVKFKKKTEKRWVIVNGNDVYLGVPEESGVSWRVLDGPQLGTYIFNLNRRAWSAELTGLDDLNEGLGSDLPWAFRFICNVIDTCWRFKHQQEDVQYIAAALMLNTVCSALPRQLYTMINGPRGSGKSSLLGLLSGNNPTTRLLEAAFTMDSYTVAGFRKEMNHCSLGAVLDEFEDQGNDTHSRNVRGILRDIRGLTSNPEARILRGNMENPEATAYVLRCQIWAAAIQYLRDEADVSRFVQIKTDIAEGHPNPKTTMATMFSETDFRRARRALTLGMFKVVPDLLKEIKWLRGVYASQGLMSALSDHAGVTVPSRYLDGVLIPAAILKLVGQDPHEFITRFVTAKATMLKQVVGASHEKSLLDHILSAQLQYSKPGSDVRHTNVRGLLSSPTERTLLNETESGVYYVDFALDASQPTTKTSWLIVLWADAIHSVLKTVGPLRGETPARLKQLAEASGSMVVSPREFHKIPGGIAPHLKVGVKITDFTVFDITDMLTAWDESRID